MAYLSRRSILRACAGAAAGGLGIGAHAASVTALQVTPVADGVFVSTGSHELFNARNCGHISNVSFVIGSDCVAVIDTGGSASVGRGIRAAIQLLTDRPIRYVINTHVHPDHVFGNAAFLGPETLFVGHAKLPRSLAARGERYLAVNQKDLGPEAFEGTRVVPPSRLVDGQTTLDLGGRTLTLKARPTAHTDNDLTVRCERTGTMFLGDLLFAEHIPTLDGSIKGWLKLMSDLKAEPAERVVPGHGPASMPWPMAMEAQSRYLYAIAKDVRGLIKSGGTLDEATRAAALTEKTNWLLFEDFHARNVSTAFAELEWE